MVATDQAIRRAVSRCGGGRLTDGEVDEIVAVFDQLWPKLPMVDQHAATLLDRFGEITRVAVSRSLEQVELGDDFGPVTSWSVLREQYGFEVDPGRFADLLCQCWVDSVRETARTVPVLQPWADQLNHDLTHRMLFDTHALTGQTHSAVGAVFGSMSVPLEMARLDPARVFADAEVESRAPRSAAIIAVRFRLSHLAGWVRTRY